MTQNKDILPAHQLTVSVKIGTMILEFKPAMHATTLASDAVEVQLLNAQHATVWLKDSSAVENASAWLDSTKLLQQFSSAQSAHILAKHVSLSQHNALDATLLLTDSSVEPLVPANLSILRIAPDCVKNAIPLVQPVPTVRSV